MPIFALVFRIISTLDAMKLDLGFDPLLDVSKGLIVVFAVLIKHVNVLTFFVDFCGRCGGGGCACPRRGVLVWRGRCGVGCLMVKLKGLKHTVTRDLAHVNGRIVNMSVGPRGARTIGRAVSKTVDLSAASGSTLGALPLGRVSTVFIAFNGSFKASVRAMTLLGGLSIGGLVMQKVSPVRRTIVHSVNMTRVVAPRSSFTNVCTSRSLLKRLFGR